MDWSDRREGSRGYSVNSEFNISVFRLSYLFDWRVLSVIVFFYVWEPACCGDLVLVHMGEEARPGVDYMSVFVLVSRCWHGTAIYLRLWFICIAIRFGFSCEDLMWKLASHAIINFIIFMHDDLIYKFV